MNQGWEEIALDERLFSNSSGNLFSKSKNHLGGLRSGSILEIFHFDDVRNDLDDLRNLVAQELRMNLSHADDHFHGLLSEELVSFERINGGVEQSLSQWLELLQDLLVLDAQQERSGCSEGGNSHSQVRVLHGLLEDGVKGVLVCSQLGVRQMALGLLLEDVHGELLRLEIVRLSPLNQEGKELLVLILQSEHLGDEVAFSLQENYVLVLEVKRLQHSFLHGRIV